MHGHPMELTISKILNFFLHFAVENNAEFRPIIAIPLFPQQSPFHLSIYAPSKLPQVLQKSPPHDDDYASRILIICCMLGHFAQ